MLQGEHSAILLTFIKLPFVIKVLSIFEWPLYTGFTVMVNQALLKKLDGQERVKGTQNIKGGNWTVQES